jgi:hypothetical protein
MTLIATRFANTGTGGDGFNHVTVDLDFPPMNALVTVSISRFGTGGGVVQAGILDYRIRNNQGVDVPTSFGDLSNLENLSFDALPAGVAHNNMTHITMLVMTFTASTRGQVVVLGTDFGEDSNQ